MKTITNKYVIILISLSFLFTTSCREEEQNRLLQYNKGVYLGKKDEKLDKKIINLLSLHVSRQSYN